MSLLQAIARVTQSFIEQRRSIREQVQFPAWIGTGDNAQPRECTVVDVSDGGARIMVSSPIDLPREFWLLFTRDGKRRRRCRIAWQSDGQIGVAYLGPPQSDEPHAALN
jgi:hypothetical protein